MSPRPPLSAAEAAAQGMLIAFHARSAPDRLAILSPCGDRSFAELAARAFQLARALRAGGLQAGDAIALLCSNRPEFVEAYVASQCAGLRITPINWHLTGEEVGYVVADCEAKAFLADARFAATAVEAAERAPAARKRLAIGGGIDGFESYDKALAEQPSHELEEPRLGTSMLYTSGTTGRPKGVHRKGVPRSALTTPLTRTAGFRPTEDLALVTGPLYHAAPLALNLAFPLAAGVGCVLMERWDPHSTLEIVERFRVSHTHMVPTMFHRLLALPPEERARRDTSSLRWVLHGAAPCPVHVKRAMIEWLGPVLFEYYAATEGGGTFITGEEWLRKPGSVGRRLDHQPVEILDEAGAPLPPGKVGTVYFGAPPVGRFEYFHAPEKTAAAYRGDAFTMGDLGYFDEDGFLFLTGRSAEVIISGGVNVYPAEIDAALLEHPAVADVATVGVPNEEWGEEVKAVVQLQAEAEPSPALAAELLAHARSRLAAFKCPRSVDFTDELPRLPTGKIVRRLVRDRYWQGRSKKI
ncbi:MAG TPA: AMP-binding protein [Myxococcota bacterium]|nr:AMP-binding protein [Myxococcota bacterium]